MKADLKNKLNEKVENSLFYEEIDRLKDLINQLASSGVNVTAPLIQMGPQLSTKDLTEIKEAIKKIAVLEDQIKEMNIEPLIK